MHIAEKITWKHFMEIRSGQIATACQKMLLQILKRQIPDLCSTCERNIFMQYLNDQWGKHLLQSAYDNPKEKQETYNPAIKQIDDLWHCSIPFTTCQRKPCHQKVYNQTHE